MCKVLPISPSAYHGHVVRRADPAKASPQARHNRVLMEPIRRVHATHFGAYGARRVQRKLGREDMAEARCTVERLMRRLDLQGAVRGKEVRTRIADKAAPCPADKVKRSFWAPQRNLLRVSDFTKIATWQGFVQAAFVNNVFARRIIGCGYRGRRMLGSSCALGSRRCMSVA